MTYPSFCSSDVLHTINIVKLEITDIKSWLSLISCVMVEEVEEALEILNEILETLTGPSNVQKAIGNISWDGTEVMLIILQNIYKQTMSINLHNSRFVDILSQLINLLRNLNSDKVRDLNL